MVLRRVGQMGRPASSPNKATFSNFLKKIWSFYRQLSSFLIKIPLFFSIHRDRIQQDLEFSSVSDAD